MTSAQARHWTDPATRHERVAALLRPGGALAVFWNLDRLADDALPDRFLAAHREIVPDMSASLGPVAHRDFPELPDLAAHPAFRDVERRVYTWTRTLSRDDCLTLLSTHSEYRMLDDDARSRLFAAGAAATRSGGIRRRHRAVPRPHRS